jgi:anti-sigma B factor antagonist
MGLTINHRDAGNIVVLDLSGDSSITDGTLLQQKVRALIDESKRFFVLNLKDVRYLDSFGLGQIVAIFQNIRNQKGDLKIVNPNKMVTDLLKHTRIDRVVQVVASEAEAVQELQKLAL